MKNTPAFIACGLGTLVLSTALIVTAAPAPDRTDSTAVTASDAAAWHDRMRERTQARLDALAKRLQINASQQDAWNAYASTIESMFDMRPARPAADADAATIARFRAELAANHARKLPRLADATAKLQEVLDPEQRKTLDELAHRHRYEHRHHPRS